MTENGTVVECKGNFALVRIGRNSACASCGKCGMTESQEYVDFLVENTLSAQKGEVVSVEIPEGNSVKLAFVAYVLPIIPAILMLVLGVCLGLKEWISALMFLGGLTIGFGFVVMLDRIRKHKWAQAPTMLKVVCKTNNEQQKGEQNE